MKTSTEKLTTSKPFATLIDEMKVSKEVSQYMSELGKRGGKALKQKYGKEHYQKIGALGGKKKGENAALKTSTNR